MSFGIRFQILAGNPSPDYLKAYGNQNFTSHLWQIFGQIYLDNTLDGELKGKITNKED